MKKKLNLLLVFALVLSLVACGSNDDQVVESETREVAETSEPVETSENIGVTEEPGEDLENDGDFLASVTDATGEEVKVGEVERIVCLVPSTTEIIAELGILDKIVGRGPYCDYPAEVLEVPDVGSVQDVNLEEIIALDPDLVIMGALEQNEEQIKTIKDLGIPVYLHDAGSLEAVYQEIENMGVLLGEEDQAQELIGEIKESFAQYEDLEAKDPAPSIYFEISPLEFGLWTSGKETFMDDFAGMMKAENIFGDIENFQEVSEEEVIARNPDIIISTSMQMPDGPDPVDEILNRPGWESITALENRDVYLVNPDIFNRPGPRLVEAAQALHDILYAE